MSIENIIVNVQAEMKAWGMKIYRREAPTVAPSNRWSYDAIANVVTTNHSTGEPELDHEFMCHELVHHAQPAWVPDYYSSSGEVDVRKWINNPFEIQAIVVARCMAEPWVGHAIKSLVGTKPWRHHKNAARHVGAALGGVMQQCMCQEDWARVYRLLPQSNKLEALRQYYGRVPKKRLSRSVRKSIKRMMKKMCG